MIVINYMVDYVIHPASYSQKPWFKYRIVPRLLGLEFFCCCFLQFPKQMLEKRLELVHEHFHIFAVGCLIITHFSRDSRPVANRILNDSDPLIVSLPYITRPALTVSLTHCGRVTQICVFNTVKLGTSASSP